MEDGRNKVIDINRSFHLEWNIEFLEAREENVEDTLSSEVLPLASEAQDIPSVLIDPFHPTGYHAIPPIEVMATSELAKPPAFAPPPSEAIVSSKGNVTIN